MDISEMLRTCEDKLLEVSVRKNGDIVSSLLADDFREFGSSGQVYTKSQIIAALQSETPARISMRNFKAQLLADEVALITYVSSKVEHGGTASEALRSSIWISRGGQWKMLFHQGTKALQPSDEGSESRNER